MTRARRLAIAATVCALLAGWLTLSYTGRAVKRAGPLQNVVVAAAPMERGADVGASARLSIRRVPMRFAPSDALSDPADAVGERLQVAVPVGAFLTRSMFGADEHSAGRFKLRPSERALTVDVVVSPAGETLSVGDRIDLYASGFGGNEQTESVIAGAEVLAVSEGAQPDRARPTIRLAAAQIAAVVRADVFAHELRAVLRP